MEKPLQSVEDSRLEIPTSTIHAISSVRDKNIAYEIKKDLCKVQEPEWTPITIDYNKLHKHYLKLAKIRLTGMYTYIEYRII